jgi:hypothetical protein
MRFYLEPKPSRRSIPFSRPVATSPVAAATEPTVYRSTTRHRPSYAVLSTNGNNALSNG